VKWRWLPQARDCGAGISLLNAAVSTRVETLSNLFNRDSLRVNIHHGRINAAACRACAHAIDGGSSSPHCRKCAWTVPGACHCGVQGEEVRDAGAVGRHVRAGVGPDRAAIQNELSQCAAEGVSSSTSRPSTTAANATAQELHHPETPGCLRLRPGPRRHRQLHLRRRDRCLQTPRQSRPCLHRPRLLRPRHVQSAPTARTEASPRAQHRARKQATAHRTAQWQPPRIEPHSRPAGAFDRVRAQQGAQSRAVSSASVTSEHCIAEVAHRRFYGHR
jgi:hypothetical protein